MIFKQLTSGGSSSIGISRLIVCYVMFVFVSNQLHRDQQQVSAQHLPQLAAAIGDSRAPPTVIRIKRQPSRDDRQTALDDDSLSSNENDEDETEWKRPRPVRGNLRGLAAASAMASASVSAVPVRVGASGSSQLVMTDADDKETGGRNRGKIRDSDSDDFGDTGGRQKERPKQVKIHPIERVNSFDSQRPDPDDGFEPQELYTTETPKAPVAHRTREPKLRPQRRRPIERRPEKPSRYENDRDECDDDDDGGVSYNEFMRMAAVPMRHIRRMMNSALDQMQASAYGDGGGRGDEENKDDDYRRPSRGSSALAAASSSYSGGGGGDNDYSRQQALVSSNGRTRGLVSETRNGRTHTRRIGERDSRETDDDEQGK